MASVEKQVVLDLVMRGFDGLVRPDCSKCGKRVRVRVSPETREEPNV